VLVLKVIEHKETVMMPDTSEDIRLPVACPSCGSHLYRVNQVRNPTDEVHCASCKRYLCDYHEAVDMLEKGPGDEAEALIEKVVNRRHH
jgi:predicted RNA-binding Zn-ribbon protein involved in translation (DUF1610 family)